MQVLPNPAYLLTMAMVVITVDAPRQAALVRQAIRAGDMCGSRNRRPSRRRAASPSVFDPAGVPRRDVRLSRGSGEASQPILRDPPAAGPHGDRLATGSLRPRHTMRQIPVPGPGARNKIVAGMLRNEIARIAGETAALEV